MNFIKRKHCFYFQIVGYSNIIMYNSNATSYETLSDKCPLKKTRSASPEYICLFTENAQ